MHKVWSTLRAWDRRARRAYVGDLSTPAGRRRAYLNFNLFDHAFLRVLWTNFHEIAPGVFRSNQPGPRRVARWHSKGIKSILFLRGKETTQSFFLLEQEAAAKHGITMHTVALHARNASARQEFLDLFDAFEKIEGPWVMHCKSGADRAGLASALYILWSGGTLDAARQQLSVRYLHLNNKNTGICDYILEEYGRAHEDSGADLRTWFKETYDAAAIQAAFDKKVGRV